MWVKLHGKDKNKELTKHAATRSEIKKNPNEETVPQYSFDKVDSV